MGYAKVFLTMFVKRKKNRSGTTSIVVAEKTKGIYKELITIGVAKDSNSLMQVMNGFQKKNPGAIHNSICMVRSVKRVTVSEKKSAVFCPMSATSFSTDAT